MADDEGRLEAAHQAVRRWLDAVDSRGDRAIVEAAMHPTIRLERFGFGSLRGELVEIFEGPGPICAWLARTPETVRFSLADENSPAEPESDGFVARYRLESEGFVGGGVWRFRLADDGRIGYVAHQPDDLDDGANRAVGERMSHELVERAQPESEST